MTWFLTMTVPGFNSGFGTSRRCITSGPPRRSNWIAFICSPPVDDHALFRDPHRGVFEVDKIRLVLDRNFPGTTRFRRRHRIRAIDPGLRVTGIRRHLGPARGAQLLLDRIFEAMDLEIFFQTVARRETANDRAVIGPPVELRLLECLI